MIDPEMNSGWHSIGIGFISYTLLKLVKGRIREVPLLLRIFAVIFLLKYFTDGSYDEVFVNEQMAAGFHQ